MINFEIVCRTCSLQGELQPLFVGDLLNPAEMLNDIIDIKVIKNDKYPQNICVRCLDVLKSAYLFKHQCHEMHKKFEQYLLLNSETIVDSDQQLFNAVYIKEEKESPHCSEINEDWFDPELSNIKTENHTTQTFECEKCSVTFQNQKSYKRHIKTHKEQSYMCPICGKQFSRKNNFEQHFNRKHFTDRPFENIQPLQYQVKLENDTEIHNPNESGQQIVSQDPITPKKKYICDYCGRGYCESYKLTTHIRTHTGEKPYSCTECNKPFHSKTLLTQHIRLRHTKEKPYKCEFCGKSFGLSRWLKLHLRIHTNDKPFTCDICNQKFRQIHHLTRHKFVHTGEKPFSCSVCNKQFTQNSNLRTHMRTHTGEKPYVCSICGKGFHDSSSMKNHCKNHTLLNNAKTLIGSSMTENTK